MRYIILSGKINMAPGHFMEVFMVVFFLSLSTCYNHVIIVAPLYMTKMILTGNRIADNCDWTLNNNTTIFRE